MNFCFTEIQSPKSKLLPQSKCMLKAHQCNRNLIYLNHIDDKSIFSQLTANCFDEKMYLSVTQLKLNYSIICRKKQVETILHKLFHFINFNFGSSSDWLTNFCSHQINLFVSTAISGKSVVVVQPRLPKTWLKPIMYFCLA